MDDTKKLTEHLELKNISEVKIPLDQLKSLLGVETIRRSRNYPKDFCFHQDEVLIIRSVLLP